jgi:hypothetical protein
MTSRQIIGVVALVVGLILIGFGFNAADAPADKISETFTGRYTDRTMWYFILGAIGVIAGGLLAVFGRRST